MAERHVALVPGECVLIATGDFAGYVGIVLTTQTDNALNVVAIKLGSRTRLIPVTSVKPLPPFPNYVINDLDYVITDEVRSDWSVEQSSYTAYAES